MHFSIIQSKHGRSQAQAKYTVRNKHASTSWKIKITADDGQTENSHNMMKKEIVYPKLAQFVLWAKANLASVYSLCKLISQNNQLKSSNDGCRAEIMFCLFFLLVCFCRPHHLWMIRKRNYIATAHLPASWVNHASGAVLLIGTGTVVGRDGQLKVCQWGSVGFTEVIDLLNTYADDCGYPTVCGNYGVCTKRQRGCIEATNAHESQINFWQPELGCSLLTPISSDHVHDHSLLELKNASYFAFQTSFAVKSGLDKMHTIMEECKSRCLSNCSCKAAAFSYTDPWLKHLRSNGSCLLLNEVFPIIKNENFGWSAYNTTLLVKAQNASVKASRRKTVILASTFGAFFLGWYAFNRLLPGFF